jgi:hypothetical protein
MANIEEALVATLWDQSDNISDEITNHHPVLATLDKKGNIRKISGGYELRKPVMYNQSALVRSI